MIHLFIIEVQLMTPTCGHRYRMHAGFFMHISVIAYSGIEVRKEDNRAALRWGVGRQPSHVTVQAKNYCDFFKKRMLNKNFILVCSLWICCPRVNASRQTLNELHYGSDSIGSIRLSSTYAIRPTSLITFWQKFLYFKWLHCSCSVIAHKNHIRSP